MFHVGLRVPHVWSEVGIRRKHCLVFGGSGTLQGKTIGKVGSSDVQTFKVEGELCRLIGGVVDGQDDGQGLLLDHLYLLASVLGQATMENWCCKLKGRPDSCLVDFDELLGSATKGPKPNEDPEFLSGSHGHIINMRGPTEVAGDDDTQESGLVYYFEWLTIREVELGEEVKLLGKIEGYDFCLLMVYFILFSAVYRDKSAS